MMTALLRDGETAELHVTDTDAGFDVSLDWKRANDPAINAAIARWASKLKLARVTAKHETLVELAQPSVRFGNAVVKLPCDAFLQPTREGETTLQARVLAATKSAAAAPLRCRSPNMRASMPWSATARCWMRSPPPRAQRRA
jgi:23S rRNA (uracil1939-C5)-methyltransferase